ncbi:transaldolase [Ereboglobus sp. PH5-5]|uniref:fructose-6-phosphate aldolase n=1 Tax=Ereboglobus sp. PH5-5 TaxID=2940529 RepID=UPI0024073A57|nr:fructose-6-phosphate aldolase [Ereboglobus sp. PH5-5]MDF9832373.1 transaldolase [Ereboglobus sp. PH5-5]
MKITRQDPIAPALEILLDSANISEIRKCNDLFELAGVTSNPLIIKNEGKINFYPHFSRIRKIIGKNKTLHIQTLASTADGMIAEARAILDKIDDRVYIKIPVTEQGLKAMKQLAREGARITATCIYTRMQAYLAIAAGADYLAPYCNRMEQMGIDFRAIIAEISDVLARTASPAKIVAASFKNITQATDALAAGANTVTVTSDILHSACAFPPIDLAVKEFHEAWISSQGKNSKLTTP